MKCTMMHFEERARVVFLIVLAFVAVQERSGNVDRVSNDRCGHIFVVSEFVSAIQRTQKHELSLSENTAFGILIANDQRRKHT